MLKVDLIVQGIPPLQDAIGEYTNCLAAELAKSNQVRILTCRDFSPQSIEGVDIVGCFSLVGTNRFRGLTNQLDSTNADAVILQYNPFAWGKRGWAPDLIRTLYNFKRKRPEVAVGVMFHETYMMNPGWRSWVMRLYQRRQFQQLVRLADVSFFSIETWSREQQRLHPTSRIIHLPVGANLPESKADPVQTRKAWKIEPNDFVCGVFGGAHPSRMLSWIESATKQIATENANGSRVVFLHVGGEHVDWKLDNVPIIRTGRLKAAEAADSIVTMDIMLNPFSDGISTRRGSAMAALQQGVPLLTTSGHATDSIWRRFDGAEVFIANAANIDDWKNVTSVARTAIASNRARIRESAKQIYRQNFDWPIIAQNMLLELENAKNRT